MIKHIWFDFSDTIAAIDTDMHNSIKYTEFARLKNSKVSEDLIAEYDRLFEQLGNSNSNVFVSTFNLPASYWPDLINKHLDVYSLMRPNIPRVIREIAGLIPISVFSNIDTKLVMEKLGIDTSVFTHILSSAQLTFPKPHTEGYEKIVALSGLDPREILYIGDDLKKDILPAKSVRLKVGYMWGECNEADYIFMDFEDILSMVRSINSR